MTPKLKKIIVAIIVLGIMFVVWAIFLKPDPTNDILVSGRSAGAVGSSLSSDDARILSSQISQALLRIQQIVLDRTIFENNVYQSLQDRNRPISDEPTGRRNPFAPLSDTSVNSTSRVMEEDDVIIVTSPDEQSTPAAVPSPTPAPSPASNRLP